MTFFFEVRVLFLLVLWGILLALFSKKYKNKLKQQLTATPLPKSLIDSLGQAIRSSLPHPRFGFISKLRLPNPDKKEFFLISTLVFLIAFIGTFRLLSDLQKSPLILSSTPGKDKKVIDREDIIHIRFTTPVIYDTLTIHTNPQIETTVKKNGYLFGLLPFGTTITLVPKVSLAPGEHIMIYLTNIRGPGTKGFGGEQLIEAIVMDPEVTEVIPKDKSQHVATNQEVIFKFSSAVGDLREWNIKSEPEHPTSLSLDNNKTIHIKPGTPFKQGETYKLQLVHTPVITLREDSTEVRKLDARTKSRIELGIVKAAHISSFTPSGNAVNPKEPIVIEFEEAIDSSTFNKFLKIIPDVAHSMRFENGEKKLTINHEELKKDTQYKVIIAKGVKTKKGGELEREINFDFKTAGPISVTESQPSEGSNNIPVDTIIKISFDQKVASSIKDKISINPGIEGSYSVHDNIVEFKPKNNLAYETKYEVSIAKDAPSEYGLASTGEKTISFNTSPDQVILNVPQFGQQTLFTCNIAAARMLLGFRGVSVSEQDLINKIGTQAGRGSGNPHKGYVSNFGTFWDAVHRGVTQYRSARLITSGNLKDILEEVKKGKPVMTWGQNGWSNPYDISWTASDGTFIKAVNGMHSVVVRGYVGSTDNPRLIFVNDPWRGQYAMDTNTFMERWSYYKMAMVIE